MSDDFQEYPDPQDQESSLYTQLQNFLASGQWQRAKETTASLLSSSPESTYLHFQMGNILYQLNQYPQSEIHYKRTIALSPDYADGYNGLAYLYLAMGRAGTAEDNIRKAISIDPEDESSWIIFGHLALHFDDPQAAINHANKALDLDPDSLGARDILARAKAELKGPQKTSPQEQIRDHQEILRLDPENDLAHTRIGCIHYDELKDYETAEHHFRTALKIDPNDKENQKLLILTLRKRDPILRLLWSPLQPALWILNLFSWAWEKKWPILLLIFVTKYLVVIGVAISLIFFTIFWPLTKIYEYLTISDLHQKMGKIALYQGPAAKIHKLGFKTRFLLFSLIVLAFWTTIYILFSHQVTKNKLIATAGIVLAGGVILVYALSWGGLIRDTFRKARRKRKDKKLQNELSSKNP